MNSHHVDFHILSIEIEETKMSYLALLTIPISTKVYRQEKERKKACATRIRQGSDEPCSICTMCVNDLLMSRAVDMTKRCGDEQK